MFRETKFGGVWDQLNSKKLFPGTIRYKIFETRSSFQGK